MAFRIAPLFYATALSIYASSTYAHSNKYNDNWHLDQSVEAHHNICLQNESVMQSYREEIELLQSGGETERSKRYGKQRRIRDLRDYIDRLDNSTEEVRRYFDSESIAHGPCGVAL